MEGGDVGDVPSQRALSLLKVVQGVLAQQLEGYPVGAGLESLFNRLIK